MQTIESKDLEQYSRDELATIYDKIYKRMRGNGEGCEFGMDWATMFIVKPQLTRNLKTINDEIDRRDKLTKCNY